MYFEARKTDLTKAAAQVDQSLSQKLEELKASLSELVDHPALSGSSNLTEVKARVQSQINEASAAIEAAKVSAREAVSEKAENIDEYVHDEPWKVAGIAAALGLAVGVALARR